MGMNHDRLVKEEIAMNQPIPCKLAPIQPRPFCYDESAKDAHSRSVKRFYNAAKKFLPGFVIKTHFNRGGIAVWGETYAKIYREYSRLDKIELIPLIEVYDTPQGMLVRQWDGTHSGANHYVKTLRQFVTLIENLAAKPFERF